MLHLPLKLCHSGLVTIVKEKNSRSTFCQLDGEVKEESVTTTTPPSPEVQAMFQCDKCEDAFNSESQLSTHMKNVHDDWSLMWKLCTSGHPNPLELFAALH